MPHRCSLHVLLAHRAEVAATRLLLDYALAVRRVLANARHGLQQWYALSLPTACRTLLTIYVFLSQLEDTPRRPFSHLSLS